MKREVELHSTDPSAVEATRATLKMLPTSPQLIEEDGKFYVVGEDFAFWAIEHQGYVRRVLPAPDGAQ